jgi:hypothetical protein
MTTLYDDTLNLLLQSDAPYCRGLPIDQLDKLVRRRDHRGFVERFKAIIAATRRRNLGTYAPGDQDYFTRLFELWVTTLAKPGFEIVPGDEYLIFLNASITNLLSVTPLGNGDECLKRVLDMRDNLFRVLLLYTPRSRMRLDLAPIFAANAPLASLWYASLWNSVDTYVDPVVQDNCRYFLENVNDAFEPYDSDCIIGYFRSTYVNNMRDRFLKRKFANGIAKFARRTAVRNAPNPKSIAVVSSFWNSRHAVHRAFEPYIRELARSYDLTLVDLDRGLHAGPPADGSLFKRVIKIAASNDFINVTPIVENDFQLAYFPDMGMSQESIYLASMRLAPIQCMGTGHPVSSACPEMDYFISGAEVETKDSPEDNYDERLVLLPGLSVQPVKPNYVPKFPEKPDQFIVNLPWMHMKNNHDMALLLKDILGRVKRETRFSIFPGCGITRNGSYMATIQDYARILPSNSFFINPNYHYDEYMAQQEKGRFTMHSFPFGGGTTLVDALVIGLPLTVLRGRHEYNRYSAAVLNRIGLGELVADTKEEWIDLCVRLIDDDAYLADVTARVRNVDLDAAIFRLPDADNLRRCFDTLIKHHDSFAKDGSRKPIEIQ